MDTDAEVLLLPLDNVVETDVVGVLTLVKVEVDTLADTDVEVLVDTDIDVLTLALE